MECDHVFVVLTAGPFPAGRPSDAAVNRHLMACAECRRIAEALRPYDEQTHEALTARERAALPRYRGVSRPVTTMAVVSPNGVAMAGNPGRPAASDWRRQFSVGGVESQVASFLLAPRPRTATMAEALSMLATLAIAAAAFWCLGMLAL